MAQRVQTILIDDISGEEITDGEGDTIHFAWGGVAYQIDLSAKNIAKFEKAITPFDVVTMRSIGRRRRNS